MPKTAWKCSKQGLNNYHHDLSRELNWANNDLITLTFLYCYQKKVGHIECVLFYEKLTKASLHIILNCLLAKIICKCFIHRKYKKLIDIILDP
jgi:hypothetical protein